MCRITKDTNYILKNSKSWYSNISFIKALSCITGSIFNILDSQKPALEKIDNTFMDNLKNMIYPQQRSSLAKRKSLLLIWFSENHLHSCSEFGVHELGWGKKIMYIYFFTFNLNFTFSLNLVNRNHSSIRTYDSHQ